MCFSEPCVHEGLTSPSRGRGPWAQGLGEGELSHWNVLVFSAPGAAWLHRSRGISLVVASVNGDLTNGHHVLIMCVTPGSHTGLKHCREATSGQFGVGQGPPGTPELSVGAGRHPTGCKGGQCLVIEKTAQTGVHAEAWPTGESGQPILGEGH